MSRIIPVYVQRPSEPQSRTLVGEAPDNLSPQAVAKRVRVPDDCLIDGKVMWPGRKFAYWCLVARSA